MRTTLAMAAAAALLATPLTTPADAAGGGTITCTLYYDNWSGASSGTGYCTATGLRSGSLTMRFFASSQCPSLTQSMSGTFSGALYMSFNWARNGTAVVMTTSGDIQGAFYGVATSSCGMDGEKVVFGGGGA